MIDTSGVTDPAPQGVYQTYRYGWNFDYTLTGLTPGVEYALRLHFSAFDYTWVGEGGFDVLVNGTVALENYDVYATAGGAERAVIETLPATADAQGQVIVAFAGRDGAPAICVSRCRPTARPCRPSIAD